MKYKQYRDFYTAALDLMYKLACPWHINIIYTDDIVLSQNVVLPSEIYKQTKSMLFNILVQVWQSYICLPAQNTQRTLAGCSLDIM